MELSALSPPARDAAQNRTLQGDFDPATFPQLLDELLAFDRSIDDLTASRLQACTWSAVVLIATFIFNMVRAVSDDTLLLTAATVLPVAAAGHLYWRIRRWQETKQMSLEQSRLETLRQIFALIRRDLAPQAPFKANIDLSVFSEKQLTPSPGRKDLATVQLPWCHLRCKLRDGYVIVLRQTDQLAKRTLHKRSRSGKTKEKVSWRKECRVTASLIAPRPVTWNEAIKTDRIWERLKVANKRGNDVATLDRWWLFKDKRSSPPEKTPTGQDLVGMLFRLCSMRPQEAK